MDSRITSSTCFWLRLRSLRSFRAMFSQAWLRWPAPPTQVDRVATSGRARTMASTCCTFSSVRARLLPTGRVTLSWV